MQTSEKIVQVFITFLIGELTLQWINPRYHCVPLSIGSSQIFVHFNTQVGCRVTDVCLHCGDENFRMTFL